jgi:hypothetical protein
LRRCSAAQTEYFDANTYDASRADIYAQLAGLAAAHAGVGEKEVLALLARVEVEGQLNTGRGEHFCYLAQTHTFHHVIL